MSPRYEARRATYPGAGWWFVVDTRTGDEAPHSVEVERAAGLDPWRDAPWTEDEARRVAAVRNARAGGRIRMARGEK